MTVRVKSLTNELQTIDSVALPAWASQLRSDRTAALNAAEAAKLVQIDEALTQKGFKVQVAAPASGATVTVDNDCNALFVNNSATLAALTVAVPSSPYDGQLFYVTTKNAVTTMLWSGGTLQQAYADMTIGGFVGWKYNRGANKWFRVS